jgi:hypothetical protein
VLCVSEMQIMRIGGERYHIRYFGGRLANLVVFVVWIAWDMWRGGGWSKAEVDAPTMLADGRGCMDKEGGGCSCRDFFT